MTIISTTDGQWALRSFFLIINLQIGKPMGNLKNQVQ